MNKIKRAIIMAAGRGERLYPVTLEIPKPLIKINGVPMIEIIIESLKANGINEIHIVVGYLKEQFTYLKTKFDCINLIDNPYYEYCNNISSLYVAREYLEDVLIMDGDQVIYNKDIFFVDFEYSGYNAIWTEENTKEWLMNTENNIVTSCRVGGDKGWQLYSISRWNKEDGLKLARHLEIEFKVKNNYTFFWDDVPMFCYLSDYKLVVYPMKKEDVVEIDSLDELIEIDKEYEKYKYKQKIKKL